LRQSPPPCLAMGQERRGCLQGAHGWPPQGPKHTEAHDASSVGSEFRGASSVSWVAVWCRLGLLGGVWGPAGPLGGRCPPFGCDDPRDERGNEVEQDGGGRALPRKNEPLKSDSPKARAPAGNAKK
jgi:hypothetical protein